MMNLDAAVWVWRELQIVQESDKHGAKFASH